MFLLPDRAQDPSEHPSTPSLRSWATLARASYHYLPADSLENLPFFDVNSEDVLKMIKKSPLIVFYFQKVK